MVRCGMFAYENDSAIIIRKAPMSSNEIQAKRCGFKGVIFATKDNYFLAMRIGEGRGRFKRAVKKLSKDYRLPFLSDCNIIYLYHTVLCEAFKKMHLNLNKYNEYFYVETKISNEESPCVFNFMQGSPVNSNPKSASAGSIQIIEIKK